MTGIEPAFSLLTREMQYQILLHRRGVVERIHGFEPRISNWKSDVLPLNTISAYGEGGEIRTPCVSLNVPDLQSGVTPPSSPHPHIINFPKQKATSPEVAFNRGYTSL